MSDREIGVERESWDERHGLVVTAPKPTPGFRLTEQSEPPAAEATAAYRTAVLKIAKVGKDGMPDEAVCTAADRRQREVRQDLDTARRRFAWTEQLRTLPKLIAKAESQDREIPEPRGVRLSDLADVRGLLEALDAYRAERSAWENKPRGARARQLQNELGRAETGLRDSSDAAIAREIVALQEQRLNVQRRREHWSRFLDEATELQAVKATLNRLSQGTHHLLAAEKTRGYRSWWENFAPFRAKRDAEDARADGEKISELYAAAKKRLAYLQSRAELHKRAAAEVTVAEKELGRIADETGRLRAEQLSPERMSWTT
jgi:hypothetical protein